MADPATHRNNQEVENVRLIRAFLENDKRAFDQLIHRHSRKVFNLCFRFLGNYDDADDCAQEVFIKVHGSLRKFKFESNFSTWLYRVTVNTCKNKLGSLEYRMRFRKIGLTQEKDMNNKKPGMEISDNSYSPVSVLKRKEISSLIQKAVNKLPLRQKLVVVLRDMEGRSYREITEITGFKSGTVKSVLSRARQKLRIMLQGKI